MVVVVMMCLHADRMPCCNTDIGMKLHSVPCSVCFLSKRKKMEFVGASLSMMRSEQDSNKQSLQSHHEQSFIMAFEHNPFCQLRFCSMKIASRIRGRNPAEDKNQQRMLRNQNNGLQSEGKSES